MDSIVARKDAFFIKIRENQLLVVGSDGRGTAYGILELSRLAGVSPWVWWGDVTPMRKERLTLPADYSTFQSPSVEYRGIFLNDEDWSLQPWSWKNFEPSDIKGRIGARTYKEIFKLLMRFVPMLFGRECMELRLRSTLCRELKKQLTVAAFSSVLRIASQ